MNVGRTCSRTLTYACKCGDSCVSAHSCCHSRRSRRPTRATPTNLFPELPLSGSWGLPELPLSRSWGPSKSWGAKSCPMEPGSTMFRSSCSAPGKVGSLTAHALCGFRHLDMEWSDLVCRPCSPRVLLGAARIPNSARFRQKREGVQRALELLAPGAPRKL